MKKETSKELVVSSVSLSPIQLKEISLPTPEQFIKQKPGRGGRAVKYVEGGYIISRLNGIFGPLNWGWEETSREKSDRITEQGSEGEVTVHGRLTIYDHKNGYKVSKEADGQHSIHKNVPIGDAYKAANTDALKKAASLFGIAIDVYWKDFEGVQKPSIQEKQKKLTRNDVYKMALDRIKDEPNKEILLQMKEKIAVDQKVFTQQQKFDLLGKINEKLGTKKS